MKTEPPSRWHRVAVKMLYIRLTWDLSPAPIKVLVWLPVLAAARLLRG